MEIGDRIIQPANSMINCPHYFLINLVISAHSHFWAWSAKIACVATIVCNNSSSAKSFAKNCMVTQKLRQIGNFNFWDPHKIWGKNVKQDHDYSILTNDDFKEDGLRVTLVRSYFAGTCSREDMQRQHLIQNDWLILKRYKSGPSYLNTLILTGACGKSNFQRRLSQQCL